MTIVNSISKQALVTNISQQIRHADLQEITVEKVDGESLTMRMPFREVLVGDPDTGSVHGGALTLLLDHVLGFCPLCSDQMEPCITPTLDLRIDHLGVSTPGLDILATACVYRVTRRVIFVEGYAYCEFPDKPIARATGSFVRMAAMTAEQLYNLEENS